tara:strand:- start:18140 stop:19987 length:1848 start_codon:yes stop_codon:yes gene_type:complete
MRNDHWSQAFFKTCKPRPVLECSQWADQYRYVAPGTSPEPGEWETSRVPYLKEPMDCCSDQITEEIVMMCSSQIGKSELLINVNGYYAHQDPAPQLMIQPTVEAAEAFSKERLDPTFKHTKALYALLDEGKEGRGAAKKSGNTIRMKHYPGGYIAMVGANSPAGLASRPVRVVLADEIDRYVDTKEGDPLKLAIQRTENFHNKKLVFVSTPTILGISKINERFERSDQRRYHLPCPACGSEQHLEWSQLKFKKDNEGNLVPGSIHYECKHCKEPIHEKEKMDLLQKGRWIASQPFRRVAGFHINALYSPWTKWEKLVEQWIEIHKSRDRTGLMEFINLKLGEPFVDSFEQIDEQYMLRRREFYDAELPNGVLLLTAGVDTQPDRLEAELVGWGVGKESWGIEYRTFMGDPDQPQVWEELDQWLQKQWAYKDGRKLGIACTIIDSAGHNTSAVYKFCKPREPRRVFAGIGRGGLGREIVSKPTRNNRMKCALFTVADDTGKITVLSNVRIEEAGPGYCHFPRGDFGYTEEYFKGLLSEKRKIVIRGGLKKIEWEKIHERNEPLDCRKYAVGAMEIINPDFDWLAEDQSRLSLYVPSQSSQGRANKKRKRVISQGVN